MRQIAVACKGLQLFWFALRITVFWVARSVQVTKVVSAKALGEAIAVSEVKTRALEIRIVQDFRTRESVMPPL